MTIDYRLSNIDEQVVAQLWERQAFDPAGLEKLGLQLIFRGLPSDAGGPDYQDAMFSRGDGTLLRGDVEFHVRSSDWYRHGHHRDRAYDRVILHVVWADDQIEAFRADGTRIPTLSLSHSAVAVQKAAALPLLAHPCVSSFQGLRTKTLEQRLIGLGRDRFEQRRDIFGSELEVDAPDQVAYRGLLEALGYAANRKPFCALAEAVPYGWIMSVPPAHRLDSLLAASGFAEKAKFPPPAQLPAAAWRLSRLRPANHPVRRLSGLADLLETLRPSLAEALAEAVIAAEMPSQLRKKLLAPGKTVAWIGPGRADEMAASVVLPFVAAYEARAGALDLFVRYPSPPSNRWTRLVLDLLEQAGHHLVVRTAPMHQGLHRLYHEFCRVEEFERCAVCGDRGSLTSNATSNG